MWSIKMLYLIEDLCHKNTLPFTYAPRGGGGPEHTGVPSSRRVALLQPPAVVARTPGARDSRARRVGDGAAPGHPVRAVLDRPGSTGLSEEQQARTL